MQANIKLMKKNTLLNPVYFKTDNNGTNKKNAVQKEDLEMTQPHHILMSTTMPVTSAKKNTKMLRAFRKACQHSGRMLPHDLYTMFCIHTTNNHLFPPKNRQTFSQAALPEGHERL